MRILGVFIAAFLLYSTGFGQSYDQVSGYLGKRFSAGMGLTVSPSLEPQQAVGPDEQPDYRTGFNRMFSADVGYTITSLVTVGLQFGTHRTSMVVDDDRALNGIHWGEQYNWDDYEHNLITIAGSPSIRDNYATLYLKRYLYSKGGLAPVGTYVKVALTQHDYTIDFSNIRYISRSNLGFDEYGQVQFKHSDSIGTAQYTELSLAFGKSIPLADRVLMDINMEAGLHSAVFRSSATNWNTPAQLTYDLLRERLARAHYLKFSFGLNVLLF